MSVTEIAEHFGITIERASRLCASGERFLRRYSIEKIPEDANYKPGIPLSMWQEWDRVRIMVNPNAKRV